MRLIGITVMQLGRGSSHVVGSLLGYVTMGLSLSLVLCLCLAGYNNLSQQQQQQARHHAAVERCPDRTSTSTRTPWSRTSSAESVRVSLRACCVFWTISRRRVLVSVVYQECVYVLVHTGAAWTVTCRGSPPPVLSVSLSGREAIKALLFRWPPLYVKW